MPRNRLLCGAALLAVGASAVCARAGVVVGGSHIDLMGWLGAGTGGSASSSAHAINNAGQVVGESTYLPGVYRAYRYTDGVGMVNLGQLPGAPVSVNAAAINGAGTTVGWGPANGELGFIYKDGVGMTPVGSFGTATRVLAINNAGMTAGYSFVNGFGNTAYTQSDGGPIVPFGTSTTAPAGVNSSNTVTGTSPLAGAGRAFVFTPGGSMTFLPVPADSNRSNGNAINDLGQVVGETRNNNLANTGAFVWSSALGTQRLPTLPGSHVTVANGINNLGWIVGYTDGPANNLGLLWLPGQSPINLTDYVHTVLGRPDIQILSAEGINDFGQIVGQAQVGSVFEGYRLTIPAPASAGGLALVLVMATRRNRRV